MAEVHGLYTGGDPFTTYDTWDDPPSSTSIRLKMPFRKGEWVFSSPLPWSHPESAELSQGGPPTSYKWSYNPYK